MKFEVNLRWVVLENLEIDKIIKDHVSAYPARREYVELCMKNQHQKTT